MRTFTICLLLGVFSPITVAAHQFQVVSNDSITTENSSLKEQHGDMAKNSRNGTVYCEFIVKDANEAPMSFDRLQLREVIGAMQVVIASDDTDRIINGDYTMWRVDIGAGPVGVTREFVWELKFFDPLPHTNTYVNRVHVLGPLPQLTNWRRFDLHVHTYLTDTVFEFGHPIEVMAKAATSMGLDGFGITDHSESMTDTRWTIMANDVAMNSTPTQLLIRGLEVNTAPATGNGILHWTVHGLTRPLKAPSSYPASNNGDRWAIAQLRDSLVAQNVGVLDAVTFAAHPDREVAISGYGPIRVWSDAEWDAALLSPHFLGSEFYNERVTVFDNTTPTQSNVNPFATWQVNPNWPRQYDNGMRQWQRQAQRLLTAVSGNATLVRSFLFCAGSDAHGDLNYKRWNRYGFWQLAVNDDALGAIFTAILSPTLTQADVILAMRLGRMIVSDGPLCRPRLRLPNNSLLEAGSRLTNPAGAKLVLDGVSNSLEHGPFTNVFLMRITSTAVDTLPLAVSGSNFSVEFPLEPFCSSSTGAYLVVEAHTSLGYRSVANPFIVGPATATDATVTLQTSLALLPNPVRGPLTVSLLVPQASVDVYTIDGHRLVSIPHSSGTMTLPTHQWPAGVYLVRMQSGAQTAVRKLTIVR